MANNFYFDAENNSNHRKGYSHFLKLVTKGISLAIKDNDFDKILIIEGKAQRIDIDFVKLGKSEKAIEKQEKAFANFGNIVKIWKEGFNSKKVKKTYAEYIKKVGSKKPVVDAAMESLIKAQRRNLGIFAGGKTTKAEENFYCSRQNALSLINREHQKNINKALGIDIAQSKSLNR